MNNKSTTDNASTSHYCDNCKFFAEHYAKSDTRFIALSQGHCIHPNKSVRRLIKDPQVNVCDEWEFNDDDKSRQEKSIMKVLTNIEKSLSSLVDVLAIDR